MFQQIRKNRSILNGKTLAFMIGAAALLFAGTQNAQALTVITGTVGDNGKYLLTGVPVDVTTHAVLKMTFETTTEGENLLLCAGSVDDFRAGHCAKPLNDSGGPGFTFLTLIDAASLNGKSLFILRLTGSNAASFRFTIE